MAEPIVIELQRLAADSNHSLADLVRKALIVATKLNRKDFREWLHHELHGYETGEVPQYRQVRAHLQVKNPYHGMQPFIIGNKDIEDKLCDIPVAQSVTELEALLASQSGTFEYSFSGEVMGVLLKMQNSIAALPPIRSVPRAAIVAVVEAVRTTILEWALRLEEEGILGNGLSFSAEERNRAAALPTIQIHNFQGVLGNVSHSTLTQQLHQQVHPGDFESLARRLRELQVAEPEIEDLKVAIEADPAPAKNQLGPRVSAWVGKMIAKAVEGGWLVSLDTAANLLATAIWAFYQRAG